MPDPVKIVVNTATPAKIAVNQGPITIQGGSNYTLPAANATTLGGIIVGDNLTVTANGVLSGVNSYTLPAATNSTLGGVIVGDGLSVQADGSISVGNYVKNNSQYGNLTVTDSVAFAGGLQSELSVPSLGEKIIHYVLNGGTRTDWLANTTTEGAYHGGSVAASSFGMSLQKTNFTSYPSDLSYTQINLTDTDVVLTLGKQGTGTAKTKVWTTNSILTQGYADTRYLPTANFTYANLTGTPVLATVATSGSYTDLSNLPTLFDGSYTSLTNVPATFAPSAHTHTVSQITDFPTLATVATSGLYSDLTGTPDLTGYLTTSSAASTYATISSLSSYLTTASASSTYLTISTAASTYQTVSGMSSYQTVSGMSSYLTTSSAASTYQPIGSYATTGANTFSGTQSLAGNIVDKPRLQAARDTKTAPAISAGTLTLDLNTSNFFQVSLNASITTFTITNVPTGVVASFVLEFTADGTARAVSWPASFRFPSGTTPTLTTTSGKKDVFVVYTSDDGTTFDIVIAGQNL